MIIRDIDKLREAADLFKGEHGYVLPLKQQKGKISFGWAEAGAYTRNFVLEDTTILQGEIPEEELFIRDTALSETDDGWQLKIVYENSSELVILARSAYMETLRYNPFSVLEEGNPYLNLAKYCQDIGASEDLNYLEEQCFEIRRLLYGMCIDNRVYDPALMAGYLNDFGYRELLRFVGNPPKLWRKLMERRYKPLYDFFKEKLEAAEAEYPSREQDPEQDYKKAIEEELHRLGYSGSFPDFYKEEEKPKLRFSAYYTSTYAIWKKPMRYSIHISAFKLFGQNQYCFYCGGAPKGLCESPEDYAFDNDGKSYYSIRFLTDLSEEECLGDCLYFVKMAELRRVFNNEQARNSFSLCNPLLTFARLFVFCGFALTALTGTFIWLLVLLSFWGNWGELQGFLAVFPLGAFTVFPWILFGLCFGLIQVFGYLKYIKKVFTLSE